MITNTKNFSATIFYKPNTKRPRKYRNIRNRTKFKVFAKNDPEAYYINWYNQQTGNFENREWLINFDR